MHSIKKFAVSLIVCNLLALAVRVVSQALFGAIFDEAFMWIVRVVGLAAFAFLIYHEGWTFGAADYNLVLFEHKEARPLTGAFAGTVAAIPSILLACGKVLVDVGVIHTVQIFGQDIVSVLFRLWNLPFDILFDMNAALFLVPAIATIVIAQVGYTLGIKQIRLSDYLYYARDNDE